MNDCRRSRSIGVRLMLAVAFAGCAGPEPVASVRDVPYGTPIEAGPKPDAMRCQRGIRAEIGAAVRIRAELMTPGVATDEVAVQAAAADPGTDTEVLGIPLTGAELRALRGNRFSPDPASAIGFWVNAGARERFGGIWLRANVFNVAVLHGDPATLALARCIEPPNVTYVWADVSLAEGSALLERIAADMDRWRASGIAINTIDYDETTGVVNVGVSSPDAAMLSALEAAYGPLLRLVKQDPGVPL